MIRLKLLACLVVGACVWSGGIETMALSGAYAQSGPAIRQIRVVGNKRIAPETVRNYLTFHEGERYDGQKADDSLKALIATGLFENVNISQNGGVVTVSLNESPIINQVVFEGNKEIKDETLAPEVQLKARSVFSRAKVQADVQRILDVYRRSGYYAVQVDAQIIQLDNDRVNLAFVIQEGQETKVLNITFVGNRAFSDSQLRSAVTTTETNFLSFLKSTDVYDPDRLNLDRELLRRYYLKNGYADARVVSAVADLDREGKGFFITFTVEEGELYQFGNVDIESTLPSIEPASLHGRDVLTHRGDIYNAEYIDSTTEKLTLAVAERGYAFGQIRPRVDRDPIGRTISVVYIVEQGPRVYIERINVIGNARTRDYVVRREIRLAEGDAYNRLLAEQARLRLQKLNFFKSVKLTREQGSSPDRVVLNFLVEEQPTGELSLAGGYSSSVGPIAEISYTERNLLGKGQFLRVKLSGSLESGQIDLSFTEPRFLDRNISAGFDLFHKENDFSDQSGFEQRKTGGTLRVGFALTENVWLQPSYSLVQDEVFNVDEAASEPIKEVGLLGARIISSAGYSLTYDQRNNRLNPSRGVFFALTQELAGLGGDANYLQTVAEARGYYPIYEGITLVGRLIGGHIVGYGGQDVLAVDSFFKGGETIRGFDTSGIGPRALRTDGSGDTDAIGGNIFYAGTLEVRFPIPFLPEELGFSGAVFADAGSLFDSDFAQAINNDDVLRSSVGASLLWNSPVGPLRADFAYVLTKADFDEEEFFRFGATTKF